MSEDPQNKWCHNHRCFDPFPIVGKTFGLRSDSKAKLFVFTVLLWWINLPSVTADYYLHVSRKTCLTRRARRPCTPNYPCPDGHRSCYGWSAFWIADSTDTLWSRHCLTRNIACRFGLRGPSLAHGQNKSDIYILPRRQLFHIALEPAISPAPNREFPEGVGNDSENFTSFPSFFLFPSFWTCPRELLWFNDYRMKRKLFFFWKTGQKCSPQDFSLARALASYHSLSVFVHDSCCIGVVLVQ